MSGPYYRPSFTIEVYAEFDEIEAAKTFEDKVRKLFLGDNMEVTNPLDRRPNGFDIDDGPGLPPV